MLCRRAPLPLSFCSGTALGTSRDAVFIVEGPRNGALTSTGQISGGVYVANETESIQNQKHRIGNKGILFSVCMCGGCATA